MRLLMVLLQAAGRAAGQSSRRDAPGFPHPASGPVGADTLAGRSILCSLATECGLMGSATRVALAADLVLPLTTQCFGRAG